MPATHFRAYAGGDPVVFGDCTDNTATFTTDAQLSEIVFYDGDLENEVVVGAQAIDATGDISVTFADA